MAPKKGKNAKGKKGGSDDDAHWDKLAAAKQSATPLAASEDGNSDNEHTSRTKAAVTSFASLSLSTPSTDMQGNNNDDDDDDDAGGDSLMATLKKNSASSSKKKAKGLKKTKVVDEDDEEEAAEAEQAAVEATGTKEVNADDWMEAEFGEVKEKKAKGGKKGKKGAKAAKVDEDDDDDAESAQVTGKADERVASTPSPATVNVEKQEDDEEEKNEVEEGGSKLLSKKEKEKIKKDKEKAKKKAQAAVKKQTASSAPIDEESTPTPATSTPAPSSTTAHANEATPAEEAADADDGDDADEGAAGSKNKKKKKKKTAAEKKVEVVAPKKAGGQISALRALVEAQKAAAEETERLIREHREKIEAEDRRLEEEEKLKGEEKARRKEKEKAKRDQMKKEGKLLTPKQKAEKAAAEIRLRALVGAAGNTIAGLQDPAATGDGQPKKVSYAKKKPFKKVDTKVEEPSPSSPISVPVNAEVSEGKMASEEADEDVKDEWDASDEEAVVVEKAESVKDDWDASEDEAEVKLEVKKPSPVVSASAVVQPALSNDAKSAPAKPSKTSKPAVKSTQAPKSGSAAKTPPAVTKSIPSKPVVKASIKPAAKGSKPPVESESESDTDSGSDSGSDDDSDSDDSGSDESSSEDEEATFAQRMLAQKKAEAKERRMKRNEDALKARSKDNMRSPICVILGHVDTGKTKLLDKIRQTNVQEGEAGGITQQIGATYFPMETIRSKTVVLGDADLKEYRLPGLLVIDTPGHESFTNLRTRGSSLCNIAILVVDIMHGLEPQTLESLRLLRDGKTPFIVALNKIDRLYGWKQIPDGGFQASLAAQAESVQREYRDRLDKTMLAFAEQGLNSLPYYENKDFGRVVSLVPTSAHTGEGVPDMLMLIVKLTQEKMGERLMYLSTLEATVLEVKVIEGLGTTIDVVLSNGVLHEGDRIVVCGLNGAIVTTIRALLTPQPLKELRIKGSYVHHKEVKASLGIKIVAPDLEKAIAGSRLLVLGEDDDEDELREDIMSDLTNLMESVDKSGLGVSVQASTLGSLEALLEFLKTSKIPVSSINIGPVHKSDIMRSVRMLEKAKELAVILCFDVPVDKEAERIAEEFGIRIFKADIIYHLFDAFTAYNSAILEQKKADAAPNAVWPCRLRITQCFVRASPIILGVDITEGTIRIGTPLCIVRTDPETKKKTVISLGKVTSAEINHKPMQVVKKEQSGGGVALKIECASYENAKQFGRHFDDTDEIISMISRTSIDTLVQHFRSEVTKEDLQLLVKLKSKLDVPDK